jgi:hypothetical protein
MYAFQDAEVENMFSAGDRKSSECSVLRLGIIFKETYEKYTFPPITKFVL